MRLLLIYLIKKLNSLSMTFSLLKIRNWNRVNTIIQNLTLVSSRSSIIVNTSVRIWMIVIPTPVCSPNGKIHFIQVGIYRRKTTCCREKVAERVSISVSCFLVRSLLLLSHYKSVKSHSTTLVPLQKMSKVTVDFSHYSLHLQSFASEKANSKYLQSCFWK